MNRYKLDKKLVEMEKFQDSFPDTSIRGDLRARQQAYREGFWAGWVEREEENEKLRDENEALITRLNEVLDKYNEPFLSIEQVRQALDEMNKEL